MYEITKKFEFCYGHRVWTQQLEDGYSEDNRTVCRHLHGHEAVVEVTLRSDGLNKTGMVTDFRNLGWVKRLIDYHVDHKFILDVNDPQRDFIAQGTVSVRDNKPETITALDQTSYDIIPLTIDSHVCGYIVDIAGEGIPSLNIHVDRETPLEEIYSGLLFVDFVPTSENLAKWLYNIVDFKMKQLGVQVCSVTWNETPKSKAIYTGTVG